MDVERIRIKPVWSKSKDEIWDEKWSHLYEEEVFGQSVQEQKIFGQSVHTQKIHKQKVYGQKDKIGFRRRISVWCYAAAVLVPILWICCFYTVTEEAARGEHLTAQLPDRSTVTLNAESKISYKPFEWLIQRRVKLEGEACFEVKPGSRFRVQSGNNQVSVLGTTFNVYARAQMYRVTCLTGQVEVCVGRETAVLNPNMQATFREQKLEVVESAKNAAANGWIQGKFVFVETPLSEAIAEVERQYNIHVASGYNPNHFITGNFSKTDQAEELLEIIGKPFGITFSIE